VIGMPFQWIRRKDKPGLIFSDYRDDGEFVALVNLDVAVADSKIFPYLNAK